MADKEIQYCRIYKRHGRRLKNLSDYPWQLDIKDTNKIFLARLVFETKDEALSYLKKYSDTIEFILY